MRAARARVTWLAVSALAVAGCASQDRADDAPYESGRYAQPSLVTTRPARPATDRPAQSYRLPTTNLSPAYDYDGGEPRAGQAYVDIGPYNPGYPLDPAVPDYDSANRPLYEHHDAEYGYPYLDGFYGAPARPRFYGGYRDWYYGPRFRRDHYFYAPWYRYDRLKLDRRLDRHFDRVPQPFRHDRRNDRGINFDHRRRDRTHDWRGSNDWRDRGLRYDRDRRSPSGPEAQRMQRIDRTPRLHRNPPGGEQRAQPSRGMFRARDDDGDSSGSSRSSSGSGRSSQSSGVQSLPRR